MSTTANFASGYDLVLGTAAHNEKSDFGGYFSLSAEYTYRLSDVGVLVRYRFEASEFGAFGTCSGNTGAPIFSPGALLKNSSVEGGDWEVSGKGNEIPCERFISHYLFRVMYTAQLKNIVRRAAVTPDFSSDSHGIKSMTEGKNTKTPAKSSKPMSSSLTFNLLTSDTKSSCDSLPMVSLPMTILD